MNKAIFTRQFLALCWKAESETGQLVQDFAPETEDLFWHVHDNFETEGHKAAYVLNQLALAAEKVGA